jgi:hypothetical protein
MGGEKPKTILTDQDAAMAKAISLVMPETFHGLCTWLFCDMTMYGLLFLWFISFLKY